jgi:taurine dioxygenase
MWRSINRYSFPRKALGPAIFPRRYSVRAIDVRPISGSLGAEIHGADLRSLDKNTVREIRQALLQYLVIFFRKQDLDPDSFLSFAANFGRPVPYPFVKGIDGFPEIIQVLKTEHETTNFGGVW